MRRITFAVAVVFLAAPAAIGQDMPLSMILREDAGWVKEVGKGPGEPGVFSIALAEAGDGFRYGVRLGGKGYHVTVPAPADAGPRLKFRQPKGVLRAGVVSPDGDTVFVGWTEDTAVWAYQVGPDGRLVNGEPYCPLRLRQGQDKLLVPGLTADAAGRIYAATANGVQVFDPTGRLSGVLLVPANGTPEWIGWDGEKRDRLAIGIGDAKYTRRLNTTGMK
jgi:hypothetical protein